MTWGPVPNPNPNPNRPTGRGIIRKLTVTNISKSAVNFVHDNGRSQLADSGGGRGNVLHRIKRGNCPGGICPDPIHTNKSERQSTNVTMFCISLCDCVSCFMFYRSDVTC